MKQQIRFLTIATLLSVMTTPVLAGSIELFDHSYNVDGVVSEIGAGDAVPGNVDESGFDDITGLGQVDITVSGFGAHAILAFFDHEITEGMNTFFNEFALGVGTVAAGQSAEADEPGFVFGDIYDNFLDNTLDNSNGGIGPNSADDVSMAMGWNFVLAAGEQGVVSFFLSETNGSGGLFNIRHGDLDSPENIWFWSTLDIQDIVDPLECSIAVDKTCITADDPQGADACTVPLGGANVTYAYAVTNTGTTNVDVISVLDDLLGEQLAAPAMLAPGDSLNLTTGPVFIGQDTTNVVNASANVTGDPNAVCLAADTAQVTLPLDEDGDGVPDVDDNCPSTVIPESLPTRSLGVNRFALVDGDEVFDTTSPKGKGPRRNYTTADTAGCSCTQIIEAQGLGGGHTKFGCSISAMDDWVELVNP